MTNFSFKRSSRKTSSKWRKSTKTKLRKIFTIFLTVLVVQMNAIPFITQGETTLDQRKILMGASLASQIFYIGTINDLKAYGISTRSRFFNAADAEVGLVYITAADEFHYYSGDEVAYDLAPRAPCRRLLEKYDCDGCPRLLGEEHQNRLLCRLRLLPSGSGPEEVAYGSGHNLDQFNEAGKHGFGLIFGGEPYIYEIETPGTEPTHLNFAPRGTTLFTSDHPYVQVAPLIGSDNDAAGFGFASPGVVHTFAENTGPIVNLAGNAFNSMDIVASKDSTPGKNSLVYAVDDRGIFRTIDTTSLATGNVVQPKQFVVELASILTAIDQNSENFDHFLVGHGTGNSGYSLVHGNQGLLMSYPRQDKINVLIGKIMHIPKSTDMYFSMIAPDGHNDYQDLGFNDGSPQVILVKTTPTKLVLSEITDPILNSFAPITPRLLASSSRILTDIMIYDSDTVGSTINLKILATLSNGSGLPMQAQIMLFNINPDATGDCHSSCSTCFIANDEDRCLSCPNGEPTLRTFTSEGTCSTTIPGGGGGSGPTPGEDQCQATTIPNCTKCLGSTTKCKECEQGYGLNGKSLDGGTACESCDDENCLTCNKENAGSTCQKCKGDLSVSLETGLCSQGKVLQWMSAFVLFASRVYLK